MEEKYYELTAPQKAIWLTEQYYKNTNVNNVCGTFYSSEKLDFDLLKKSLNIFLQNNDSFKIKLKEIDGEIKQYFSEFNNIDFDIVNVKNKEEQTALEEQVDSYIFTMLNSPLYKIVLFKYPDGHGGFVINSHHIISDSWTNGIVANDVALIYAKLKNNENYYKDESLSYKTYLESEKAYINSSKFEKDKLYWSEVFNTIPEVATIPSINENSNNQDSINAKRLLINIEDTVLKNILLYCEENKVSLYNFFMTVFAIYIGRVSFLDEFVIGTPILNRTNFKEKQTTGMFINTLPLKINLKNNKTFLETLKDIAINSMGLLRHQKYSFQYIIDDLRKKDSSIPKLYDILYSYQITKMNENEDSLNHTTSWTFNKTTVDDLDIHMYEWNENNSIKIAYDYKLNKYNEQDILNIHARILHIIKQILENKNILLENIEIVTPEEKNKILHEFNNTTIALPTEKNLVDLFEEQVKKSPNNIAVVSNNNKLTYKDLDEKSTSLANILMKKGIKSGDIIGVCLEKGIDLIISIWGILKCGAVYMPMYTGYPKDRLSYMISNSNAKYIIVNNNSSSLLDEKNTININSLNLNKNKKNINLKIPTNSLAYIIYTSGSTGKPKGVKISHENLINFVYSFNKYYSNNINNEDNFLSSTNMAFDVSIWEIFMPLLNGSTLTFNTEEIIKDIYLYCDNIIKNNITALYIPPNILNEVYTILSERNYTGISKLLVGVESITNTTLNKYIDLNPKIIIVNGYGPTETTICATAFLYKKDLSKTHIVPIGKPLYNNNIYILSNNNLCPINVPGELYVSGKGVGSGYLNDEVKTNQSFKKDIFFDNEKMYSTGDLAYLGEDYNIHFIGRKDNQIKLHGYRIELNEIDYVVSNHPQISKSYSTVYKNTIVNYYISNEEILATDMKQFLKDKLPFYMIPNFYIKLDKFPLTVNGKIDSKNLPHPNIKASTEYIAPKSKTEKLLCEMWCNLFNKEKISITDNFFELGGDSLTAIKFQTEALQHDIKINYGDIFANPTIEQLAKQSLKKSNFEIDPNYNYDKINKLISINNEQNLPHIVHKKRPGGIFLLGATGYLGAHILDNLLTNTKSIVYCLVRNKSSISNIDRLQKTLAYYFGDKYTNQFGKRIIVINGDITLKNLGIENTQINNLSSKINCVINSAALVKHYGDIDAFNSINIEGTNNIIDFCMNIKKKLYHISTISVSGISKFDNRHSQLLFNENNLFVNQNLDNAYIYTKFKSEVLVLEAIQNGLDATILRLGNIFNRYYDGKFQVNFSDNAYLNRLKSFISIGMIPDSFMKHSIDFSPVDYCADAIVKIICSKNNFNIFHIFNNNLVTFSDIVVFLNKLNYNICFTSDEMFKNRLSNLIENEEEKNNVSGIIPDLDSNKDLNLIFDVVPDAKFSNKFLEKVNFNWPKIDLNYFKLLIDYFKNIGYLN